TSSRRTNPPGHSTASWQRARSRPCISTSPLDALPERRAFARRRPTRLLAAGARYATPFGGPLAGHPKFKNIMHRKGAQDKKRSAAFSKLSREITVAAKSGMPDPDMNPRLRLAVNNARAASMPKDNIQRAIDKASANEGDDYEEIRYEGYGPGGVALIVEALTDNRDRTATNVRTAFSKNGGNMAATGAVSHGFERMGMIEYPAGAGDEDKIMEAAIEAGADDVQSSDDG